MTKLRTAAIATGAVSLAAMIGAVAPAHAENDFFSALFGGAFNAPQHGVEQPGRLPFASEGGYEQRPRRAAAPRTTYSGGSQAYCVRSCDGRYFPISGADKASKAESCNSFCPASDTKVVYGSTIDNATTDNGKPYSELPNAFKYRTEIVAGCTCNGKDQFGLAKVEINEDPTLRKGDIVASADGLMVSRGIDRRHGELKLSPASSQIRARYQQLPVVASD